MNEAPRATTLGSRRGMTLVEIMVVLAVMMAILAIGAPTLRSVLDVDQRSATRELAQMYALLQTEAMLRNLSFRVEYNLDRRSYKIEVGDPNSLVFSSPEAREDWEKQREAQLKLFTKKEIEAGEAPPDAAEKRFADLTITGLDTAKELPANTYFAWAWTPEYKQPVTPSTETPDTPEDEHVVYSYVFANGSCEYTVVRLASMDNPDDGYTLEVEPMSGKINIDADMRDIGAALSWLPTEAPTIQ